MLRLSTVQGNLTQMLTHCQDILWWLHHERGLANLSVAAIRSSGQDVGQTISQLLEKDPVAVQPQSFATEQRKDSELLEIIRYLKKE